MDINNEYPISPAPESEPIVDTEKNIKKCYNHACIAMLIQFAVASAISVLITFGASVIFTVKTMAQSGATDPTLLIQDIAIKLTDPVFLLISTALSYLIANLLSYFIGNAMVKNRYNARLFGKLHFKPLDIVLVILSVLGIQMVSMLIQVFTESVTNMSGIDETTAQMMAFSDNMLQNVVLVLYTVVIAAITEELLMRGIVLKALSPISKTFALFASSLLFGLMHGNFNQMFNGFLLGMVIGYAALKSRSLWLPMIIHMCANAHAMILSLLEYKLGKSIEAFESVYVIALALIGVAAAVLLVIRNGKPNERDGYPVTTELAGKDTLESTAGLTWKALFKAPCFWIVSLIYIGSALLMMTPAA